MVEVTAEVTAEAKEVAEVMVVGVMVVETVPALRTCSTRARYRRC